MKKIIILAVMAVLAVGGLIAVGPHQAPASSQKLAGAGAIDSVNYHCWAGVCEYFSSASLKSATTTPCAIQAPAATSTLDVAVLRLDTSSTSATSWDIAQAANAFATTTAIGSNYAVGANAKAFVQASTAPAAGAATVLGPNQWVVFGARAGISSGDAVGTGFVPSGSCVAKFIVSQS